MDNHNHSTTSQYLYEHEDDFEQSGGGKWIRVIGIVVYMLIILAYAWQTLELVGWLFPAENWFMKAVTVFVCDGCATLYAMAEMFYRFRLRWSKQVIFGMWVITFIFSTSATVVQMYLASVNLVPHKIDPGVTTIAYAIIIIAFVCNIIAITVVIRMEFNAAQPHRVYLDDKEFKRRRTVQPVRVVESKQVPVLAAAQAAHQPLRIDPHQVREKVDAERKPLEKKSSLWERIRGSIDFSAPAELEPPRHQRIETEEVVDEEAIEPVELPENYLDWTDKQWKAAKEQLSKEQYDELFDEVFPPEGLKPTKKGKGGRKPKNARANQAD